MSNPLYSMVNMNSQKGSTNSVQTFINNFKAFKKNFNGNPEAVLNDLVTSGKISRQQLDSAVSVARQLMGHIK